MAVSNWVVSLLNNVRSLRTAKVSTSAMILGISLRSAFGHTPQCTRTSSILASTLTSQPSYVQYTLHDLMYRHMGEGLQLIVPFAV